MSNTLASVQSHEISFELHSLGWKAFQDLCATILSEVLGQTVQYFLPSQDGGRDGAFTGTWSTIHSGGVNGSFTVQCKFTSKKGNTLIPSQLSDELKKAQRLAKRKLAENYILMTNYEVSGKTDEKIREAFLQIKGIRCFLLFGSEWITLKIRICVIGVGPR